MSSFQKKRLRPKPWLREVEYTRAVIRQDAFVYGSYNEQGEFIESEFGVDIKTETKQGFFEHWGVDFARPDITSPQLLQVTVAFISDKETGEIIKVTDTSAIRFI